mmetsp:Transcript_59046/g.127735  ORF Transcript_59046/g.127735 Transcript_59046/m.127735 type:complete len:182 (+) Transcript_59046:129-674(+)
MYTDQKRHQHMPRQSMRFRHSPDFSPGRPLRRHPSKSTSGRLVTFVIDLDSEAVYFVPPPLVAQHRMEDPARRNLALLMDNHCRVLGVLCALMEGMRSLWTGRQRSSMSPCSPGTRAMAATGADAMQCFFRDVASEIQPCGEPVRSNRHRGPWRSMMLQGRRVAARLLGSEGTTGCFAFAK